jgi:hypothetical protein
VAIQRTTTPLATLARLSIQSLSILHHLVRRTTEIEHIITSAPRQAAAVLHSHQCLHTSLNIINSNKGVVTLRIHDHTLRPSKDPTKPQPQATEMIETTSRNHNRNMVEGGMASNTWPSVNPPQGKELLLHVDTVEDARYADSSLRTHI